MTAQVNHRPAKVAQLMASPLASRCLIIAAAGKKGHERQALAIATRLGLQADIVAADDSSLPDRPLADVSLVLGAGRQAIAPARRIARRPGRRPLVAVLQPVAWLPSDFDLIWAPRHDRRRFDPSARGRVETLTAPSAVTPKDRLAGAAWIDAHGPTADGAIGVLVGGATRSHRFGLPEADVLGDGLSAFATEHRTRLLVSTSPRTGAAQTTLLRERLAGTPHLFVAWDDGATGEASIAYAGIIEKAAGFVITADSAAMLSDAAATGKPILGWRLPGGKPRFENFYAGLVEQNAMRWFDGSYPDWTYAPLDAVGTIADALRPRLGLSNVAVQHK